MPSPDLIEAAGPGREPGTLQTLTALDGTMSRPGPPEDVGCVAQVQQAFPTLKLGTGAKVFAPREV